MPAVMGLPLFDRVPSAVAPTLDDVQSEMIEALVAMRRRGRRSALLEAATGVGKTITAAKYIGRARREWDGRALFVVDEDRLVEQTIDKFTRWGLRVGVEHGKQKARDAMALYGGVDAVVATRQTLHEKRLATWPEESFTDLFIDEAHVGLKGRQLRAIRDRFSGAFVIALTATPFFGNGKKLVPDYFDETAYRYPLKDFEDGRPGAISNGHLVPPLCVEREAGVDLKGLKIRNTPNGRDYDLGELEDRISAAVDRLANVARMEVEKLGIKRALHFTPDVRSAIALAKAYDLIGLRARAIYGDLPDRDQVFRMYDAGELDVMVGCQMFTKGFDSPPTDGLIMGRPTRSYALAWQMIGRGLRLSPDTGKTCCHVVGFSWDADDGSGPLSTLDLFLEDVPDPRTREIARRLFRVAKGPADPMKIAEQAKKAREDELEQERQRERQRGAERMRIAARKRDIACRRREVDLLGRAGKSARLQIFDGPPVPGMATAQQRSELALMGVDRLGSVSESEAAAMIRRWSGRAEAGMSSYRQCHYLQWLGVPMAESMQMTAKEASGEIGRRKQGRA